MSFNDELRRIARGLRGIRVKQVVTRGFAAASLHPEATMLVLYQLPKEEVSPMLYAGEAQADLDPVPPWDHEATWRPWYVCLTRHGLFVLDSKSIVTVSAA